MNSPITTKQLYYDASAALDNLRYRARRVFITSGHRNTTCRLLTLLRCRSFPPLLRRFRRPIISTLHAAQIRPSNRETPSVSVRTSQAEPLAEPPPPAIRL